MPTGRSSARWGPPSSGLLRLSSEWTTRARPRSASSSAAGCPWAMGRKVQHRLSWSPSPHWSPLPALVAVPALVGVAELLGADAGVPASRTSALAWSW